jgi:hypothetical protein
MLMYGTGTERYCKSRLQRVRIVPVSFFLVWNLILIPFSWSFWAETFYRCEMDYPVQRIFSFIAMMSGVVNTKQVTTCLTEVPLSARLILVHRWYIGSVSDPFHLIQIRIQHFRLNTDLDPGFWWSKIEKNLQLKKNYVFFFSKIAIFPIPRPS